MPVGLEEEKRREEKKDAGGEGLFMPGSWQSPWRGDVDMLPGLLPQTPHPTFLVEADLEIHSSFHPCVRVVVMSSKRTSLHYFFTYVVKKSIMYGRAYTGRISKPA